MSITLNKQEALVEIAKGYAVYPAWRDPEDIYFTMDTDTGDLIKWFSEEGSYYGDFEDYHEFKVVKSTIYKYLWYVKNASGWTLLLKPRSEEEFEDYIKQQNNSIVDFQKADIPPLKVEEE